MHKIIVLFEENRVFSTLVFKSFQSQTVTVVDVHVHRKYNTILGSSASIERGFSFGSIIFGKFRHRLADASFEKQLMLKVNKKFCGKNDLSKYL